jgi:hypothetical protein
MNIPELAMIATTSKGQFWRLHHVGYVVASIRTVAERFARSVAASWDQTIIYDRLQAVRVTFIGSIIVPAPCWNWWSPPGRIPLYSGS